MSTVPPITIFDRRLEVELRSTEALAPATQEILGRITGESEEVAKEPSLSCADSVRGQTTEFAQGRDVSAPTVPLTRLDSIQRTTPPPHIASIESASNSLSILQSELVKKLFRMQQRCLQQLYALLSLAPRVLYSLQAFLWRKLISSHSILLTTQAELRRHVVQLQKSRLSQPPRATFTHQEAYDYRLLLSRTTLHRESDLVKVYPTPIQRSYLSKDAWFRKVSAAAACVSERFRLSLEWMRVRCTRLVIGRVMVGLSLAMMIVTVGPVLLLEADSLRDRIVLSLFSRASESPDQPAIALAEQKDTTYTLWIDRIGLSATVIPNVNPADEDVYTQALEHGIAHAQGTTLPGMSDPQTKTIFLFGHSTNGSWNMTRYNALFYKLKDLEKGDEISLFENEVEHRFVVSERTIRPPSDISLLKPQLYEEKLILQTCWPPGTNWQRLFVIARPKDTKNPLVKSTAL